MCSPIYLYVSATIIRSSPLVAKESPVELPRTLHAQLYLLAYDRKRHRFLFDRDNRRHMRWLFDFALRAAMLTDLYLTGYVGDKEGKACLASTARHDDPVLYQVLKGVAGRNWAELVARDPFSPNGCTH